MFRDESGVIAIVTALCITMFLGFATLALDTSHLAVTQNELQNAADAAALAGAAALYNPGGDTIQDGVVTSIDGTPLTKIDGTPITQGCNEVAFDTALAHNSNNLVVEVNCDLANNTGDIQRGHWSFGLDDGGENYPKDFYPDASTEIKPLVGFTAEQIDQDLEFINAVEVTVRREATPIAGFFSRILGIDSFTQMASAVAYIGFKGSFDPYELNLPIAICFESIGDGNDLLRCNAGRMINSGGHTGGNNSLIWTDFDQTCAEGVELSEPMTACTDSGNQSTVEPGPIEIDDEESPGRLEAFEDIVNCWKTASNLNDAGTDNVSWKRTLPVIRCRYAGDCTEIIGAVTVDIIWMTGTEPGNTDPDSKTEPDDESDTDFSGAPTQMGNWTYDGADEDSDGDSDGRDRWIQFADEFDLTVTDDHGDAIPAPSFYLNNSIYFKVRCDVMKPSGRSGGRVFSGLAAIPILVE